jgi:short-subunit dehydrogenase
MKEWNLMHSKLSFSSTTTTTTMSDTCAAAADTGCPYVTYVAYILAIPTFIWLLAYSIPQLYMVLRPVPDLKKRYNATWALVTGAGSGIGKALAFKLASQGLNVVIVSLDDDFLKTTMKEIKETYPDQEFRSVGVTFSPGIPYLEKIKEATKDLDINIVFNNAGFITLGFLDQAPLGKLLANVECNATAAVNITHHFVQSMVKNKRKGCIVYTSSVAGFIPTPFAAMYASTKAFVSQMAACLHIEVQSLGIDVCAVHPSPVSSNFYDKVEYKIELMEAAQKSAVPPQDLPNAIFKSIGACCLRDLGGMAVGTRMGTFFLPYNFFTACFTMAAPFLPDYKTHNATRK